MTSLEKCSIIAADMVEYRKCGTPFPLDGFTSAYLCEILAESLRAKLLLDGSVHADYVYEKFKSWQTCDIGSLEYIAKLA